jgi:hypothetical protein
MKKTYTFLAGFVLLSSMFTSCMPETDVKVGEPIEPTSVVVPDSIITPNNMSGLNQLFKPLNTPEVYINVEAGQDEIKMGQRGTIFHFYPYSFKDANGNIVTDGTINIKVVEIYTPGQMIGFRLTTEDNNAQLLESRGQMHVSATKNGQPIYATSYGISFRQDGGSGDAMALYHGTYSTPDSAMIWTEVPAATGNNAVATTNIMGDEYYVFDSCRSFTWMNIAKKHVDNSIKATFTLSMPDTSFNLTNTEVYVIYPNENSVFRMSHYNGNIPGYQTKEEIPLGKYFSIIVIRRSGENYYYYRKDNILMSLGLTLAANMIIKPKDNIIDELNTY